MLGLLGFLALIPSVIKKYFGKRFIKTD